MRVTLYLDTGNGNTPENLFATSNPCAKMKGVKRYKVVVELPDDAFYVEIDGHAPVKVFSEVVE